MLILIYRLIFNFKLFLGLGRIKLRKEKIKFEGEKIAQKKKMDLVSYIGKKRRRIERHNVNIQLDENLVESTSQNIETEINSEIEKFLNQKNISRFNFCNESCHNWDDEEHAKYSFMDINNLNQSEINAQLSKHGHPVSRDIKTVGKPHKRRVDEGKNELKFHLINFHRDKLFL